MDKTLTTTALKLFSTPIALFLLLSPFALLIGWNIATLLIFWYFLTPVVAEYVPALFDKNKDQLCYSLVGMVIFYLAIAWITYKRYDSELLDDCHPL